MICIEVKSANRTQRYRRIAVCTAIIVLILLSLPGHWIQAIQSYLYPWWPWRDSGIASSDFPFDKVVHTSLFLLCGALFVRGWRELRQRWYIIFALLLVYAVLTEVLQIFIPGRSASVWDLMADVLGIGAGVGFAVMYLRKRRL